MLNIERVSKRYGQVLANDNISFGIEGGSISVLLGPNGAGKSTIIKCIAGLLRFQGEITICSQPNKSIAAKQMLGYVPELPAVYDMLTVEEHLEFVRRAWRIDDDDGLAEELMARFELTEKRKAMGQELSKGMQQKLSICCALVHRPRVIIFDEPMVGLDPHAIKELKSVFSEFRNDGAAVLISTHMLDSVENFWDNAHIMVNGRFAVTMANTGNNAQSLEELFFEITEGSREDGETP